MSEVRIESREPHPELAEEQELLDHAYECLGAMRERAVHLKSLGYLGGDIHADVGLTPEAAAKWEADKQRRIDLLADSPSALCFGRIDRLDDECFYIGRRHVEDSDGTPVVTDWRAPVATPFYRATVVDRCGLRRRRRFLIEGRHLVDILDEDLNDPSSLAGTYVPDPLLAEVERGRTGEMRDIIATIQAEQDVIIRAPLEHCIVVQGGPGTGKTAVGLHRAAFLLYRHRGELERHRLLVVGPNPIFLRYISQVLPSLGETSTIQLTVEGLTAARFTVRAEESSVDVARLKGDPRMVDVVARAVYEHISPPSDDIALRTSFGTVVLRADDIAERVAAARARGRPTNQGRTILREQLVALAWRAHRAKSTSDIAQQESFVAAVRSSTHLKRALDKIWPALSASVVVRRLFGSRATLERATAAILTDTERDSLARKPATRASEERWTRADLALLDEAEALTNGVGQTYGHIVVDEAQDLSAMELRMITRRAQRGSLTILGDLAQATAPAAQSDWSAALARLAVPNAKYEELTVGYRVPAPIMEVANRLLPEAAPRVRAATSVRLRGERPRVIACSSDRLAAAVAAEVAGLTDEWGSVGVIAPASCSEAISGALTAAAVSFDDSRRTAALGDHVTLVSPTAAKGLEFDAVVVVEPAAIAGDQASGLRLLYVALTRAVQHLSIVHARPLPAALSRAAAA